MKLLDIVVQDAINTDLDSESRDKAIGTLWTCWSQPAQCPMNFAMNS